MPSSEVFDKFKAGKLHSGSKHGPKVTSRQQAVAIMLSEKRNEARHGGHYKESEPVKKLLRSRGKGKK